MNPHVLTMMTSADGGVRHFQVLAIAQHAADALAVRDVLRATESDNVIPHRSHGSGHAPETCARAAFADHD